MDIVNKIGQPIISYDSFKERNNTTTQNALSPSSVDNIFYEVMHQGTLSPARFEVELKLPGAALGRIREVYGNKNWEHRLYFSCETSNLPGRGVSTTPNRIYGPVREMPHERLYSGDLDLIFRMGRDMAERRIFELWMDSIVNKHSNDFMYFDDYTTNMMISQLDKENNKVYQMELFDVYPKTINPIEQSAATTDDYIRQSISFHFRKYEVVNIVEVEQAKFVPPTPEPIPSGYEAHKLGVDKFGKPNQSIPEKFRKWL